MKTWIAIPALALGVSAMLAFYTPASVRSADLACTGASVMVRMEAMPDACVYKARHASQAAMCAAHDDAIEAGWRSDEPMIWPLDVAVMTADAAATGFRLTVRFIGSLFDLASDAGGQLI